MNEPTKKCPFCAEPILLEAIKCKHCGSDLETKIAEPLQNNTQPSTLETEDIVYNTTWPFFFLSGPGYWKAKPSYWICWVVGFVTLPLGGLGFAVFAFLFVAAIISRGDWRKNELQRSIEAKK